MFRVTPQTGEPIYEQLIRQIKHAIASGAMKEGDQLPTVRELAAKLVINPNTVSRAYRELEREGLVETTAGRGSFVKISPPRLFREERKKRLQPYLQQLIAEARVLNFTDDELIELLKDMLRKFSSSCSFTENIGAIKKSGAVVLGVSSDSVESHKKFKNKYGLTFPLLSDPNRETIQKYGVWKEKNMYGKKMMGVERTTFVIDEEGKIAHIFPKVKVDGHTEKVLEKLKNIGE